MTEPKDPDDSPPGTFDPGDTAEPPPLEELPDSVPDGDAGADEPDEPAEGA